MKKFMANATILFNNDNVSVGIVEVNGNKFCNFSLKLDLDTLQYTAAIMPTKLFSFVFSDNHGDAVKAFEDDMVYRVNLMQVSGHFSFNVAV